MFRRVKESQTLLINRASIERKKRGLKTYKFGFGQSPFLPPPFVTEELIKNADRKEYTDVQGDYELRERVAQFHFRHHGIETKPENVLVAPGSKILIYTILAAIKKADILISVPSWVSYQPQVKLAGHNPIKIKTTYEERWRITPKGLVEALSKKENGPTVLIINYPGNPDGLSYTELELIELVKVIRQNEIIVISDEIYGLLSFGAKHLSFATLYPERTITTTGLSKWCGAGGWRLGVALLYSGIEPKFKKAMIGIASETYSCATTPVQLAAKLAYGNQTQIEPYLIYQNQILKKVADYCFRSLQAHDVLLHAPEGAFYLFPDFRNYKDFFLNRGIYDSNELCKVLLQESGVAMLPGDAFGMKKAWTTRLSFVDFVEPTRGESFILEKHASKIIEGITSLKSWLKRAARED